MARRHERKAAIASRSAGAWFRAVESPIVEPADPRPAARRHTCSDPTMAARCVHLGRCQQRPTVRAMDWAGGIDDGGASLRYSTSLTKALVRFQVLAHNSFSCRCYRAVALRPFDDAEQRDSPTYGERPSEHGQASKVVSNLIPMDFLPDPRPTTLAFVADIRRLKPSLRRKSATV
jgi:hypothetical protein